MHIADWVATFCEVAGGFPSGCGDDVTASDAGLPPVDSMSAWPGITNGAPDVRQELHISSHTLINGAKMKLVQGNNIHAGWTPAVWPSSESSAHPELNFNCGTDGCLFDLTVDPGEHHDLAQTQPGVAAEMATRLAYLQQGVYENDDSGTNSCPSSTPSQHW